jgi:hypothetical protein
MTRVKLMEITPALASKWLKRNFAENRNLYPQVVGWYAADMLDGRWGVSQDIISFDSENFLINGQHRLHAVIQSGATIWAYVGWGFERPDAFVMDQGRGRTLRDAIRVTTGEKVDFAHLATAAQMYGRDHRSLSQQQRWDYYEKHKKAIDAACANAPGVRSQVTAVMARAWYTQDKDRVMEFGRVMSTGESEGKKDNAAIKLRNWLQSCKINGTVPDRFDVYFKAQSAMRAFLAKKSITKLYVSSKEHFMLPGEKKATTGVPRADLLPGASRQALAKKAEEKAKAQRKVYDREYARKRRAKAKKKA